MNETLAADEVHSTTATPPENWTVVRSGELNGKPYDVYQSPDGNAQQMFDRQDWRTQLTPREEPIQARRDEWEDQFPGKSYLTPEGPTIGLEAVSRLEAEADNYGFESVDRTSVVGSYEKVRQLGKDREDQLRQKFQAEYPDKNKDELEKHIQDKRKEALEKAQTELVETAFPYPEQAGRRDKKKVDKQRQKLLAMLSKTPDEFAQLQADWDVYEDITRTKELNQLQGEALQADKGLRAKSERARLKAEISQLDEKNGGALEFMSQFGLEKDDKTAALLSLFKQRTTKHKEDPDLMEADQLLAMHDLKWRLGELLGGQGLSDEEVVKRTEGAVEPINDWLEAVAESGADPLKDLETYRNKKRAYEMWDNHHRQAMEYLGPTVMLRQVQRGFVGLAETASRRERTASEALKVVLDPSRIGETNGAHALRHSDDLSEQDIKIYAAGIRGQLSQALVLSRHEGTMMKAALLMSGFARGGIDDLSGAWDRLSPVDKHWEFKKKIIGKAAVGSFFSRWLAGRAEDKAKAALATQSARGEKG